MTDKDDVVLETTGYTMFKTIKGNRPLDQTHVGQLVKSMQKHGNLINHFPIVVNDRMEVIDGQHRLAALQQLGWPVCYRVQAGLTIDTVRHINFAQQNWTWRDYATSYAELGNVNYKRFLELADTYGFGYRVTCLFLGLPSRSAKEGGGNNEKFINGELELSLEHKEQTARLLGQLREAVEVSGHPNRTFQSAMYQLMQSPAYIHTRMIQKLKVGGGNMKAYNLTQDYLRALEDLYNFHVRTGEPPVRLF
jgi:hypothetical protein